MKDVEILHGDCRDVLPTLTGVDAIVSDPPYGIGYRHSPGGAAVATATSAPRRNLDPISGDDEPFDPSHLLGFGNVFLWGANHYASRLPEGGRWLAWDKTAGMSFTDSFSDVDFAWHSRRGAARIISFLWKGVRTVNRGESNGRRWHPSQKPVGVMLWSIQQAGVPKGGLVVDPYGGSGTTAVACLRGGYRCVVIESEAKYIPIIERRVAEARQPLFDEIGA